MLRFALIMAPSPRLLHVHHMVTIFRCNHEADTNKGDLCLRVHGSMDDADWFCISITGAVVSNSVLEFNGDPTLEHQEETCPIMQVPGCRATWGNLRGVHAHPNACIFRQEFIEFAETHVAVMLHSCPEKPSSLNPHTFANSRLLK